jgi:hypothetical protein
MTYMRIFFGKYFFVLSAILIILVIHIFSPPAYFALSPSCVVCDGCRDHVLESVSKKYPSEWHMAKTEFRLTIPFLAKILNIKSKYGIYFLQVIAGLFFFYFLSKLAYEVTNDKLITFLFALSFGFIYPGYSFVSEMEGFFDSFAFLFLLIAMLDINIIFIAVALFFAFWTDERAIISGTLVVFWWQYKQYIQSGHNFLQPTVKSYTFLGVLGVYLFLRWYLIHYHSFVNQFSGTGFSCLIGTIDYWGIAFWQMFEGFWIFVGLAIYHVFKSKDYFPGIILIFLNFIVFSSAMLVSDITRSMAYAFPTIIISFFMIENVIEIKKLKFLMQIVLFICFMYPSCNIIAGRAPRAYSPIVRIIKHVLHIPSTGR